MDQATDSSTTPAAQAADEAPATPAAPAAPPAPKRTWETILREQIVGTLMDDTKSIGWQMYIALRLITKHRAEVIRPVLVKQIGLKVQTGPFAGMEFMPNVLEGCYMPKLLGTYEMELHPHWVRFRQSRKYRTIIDIGAAEGYYAVGLAMMFPDARVLARDINPKSIESIQDLAARNGVKERIEVGGLFAHDDFEREVQGPTLVLCDIEGGERDLLDPEKAPALKSCDMIVELHGKPVTDIQRLICQRFEPTHDITIVEERGRDVVLPALFDKLDSIDRALATWEFRSSATPWAVMRAREMPAG